MPLFSIYSLALEQDQEQSVGLQQASTTLHNQTFIQVNELFITAVRSVYSATHTNNLLLLLILLLYTLC